jgi:hypothetical protein
MLDTHSTNEQPSWPLPLRVCFRFVFCYFAQYLLCCAVYTIPGIGLATQTATERPYKLLSLWLGRNVFHLHGAAAILHGSGYGDKALDWVTTAIMVALALLATLVWSVLDRRRTHYAKLFLWFRFTLRLGLVILLLSYGSIKVFLFQMPTPSLAVLNEHVGNTSPLTFLWALIGISPAYERLCGLIEMFCALLLLWRRSALIGTLLTIVVMSNVLLLNLCFDVPVKLYAMNVLAMALLVLAPDIRALFTFFVQHKPIAPSTAWVPPTQRRNLRIVFAALELVLFLIAVKLVVLHKQYTREQALIQHPSQLAGQWHLDRATPHPYLTGDGEPMTDLFLEPSGRDNIRAADDTLWGGGSYDPERHTLWLVNATRDRVDYTIQQPDANHLTLTTNDPACPELQLTRVPLPLHYPLLERGFYWVNEWGLER